MRFLKESFYGTFREYTDSHERYDSKEMKIEETTLSDETRVEYTEVWVRTENSLREWSRRETYNQHGFPSVVETSFYANREKLSISGEALPCAQVLTFLGKFGILSSVEKRLACESRANIEKILKEEGHTVKPK